MGEVHILNILKKHAESKNPMCRSGQEAKCTKSRAKHGIANMRKRIAMVQDPGEQKRLFVELAREQSDCESYQKGGDLGIISAGSFSDAQLETTMFSLAVGEISEPVESAAGVHLLLRT